MQLSVAAPGDWKITTEDDLDNQTGPYSATRYTSPSGDTSILVDELKNVTEAAMATAERWKREYTETVPPQGGQPAVAAAKPDTHQGRDAALFTTTHNVDTEGTPRRLNKTLVVVTSRQERLTPHGLPARREAGGEDGRRPAEQGAVGVRDPRPVTDAPGSPRPSRGPGDPPGA
ncbi:hypothetical protein [Streptomyces sp. NPDC003036]|uniref:hypothetical protein n=1 Tax=Streptomyces sp. NPDC003036 TaxID=3154442 RepID=UPI0033B17564